MIGRDTFVFFFWLPVRGGFAFLMATEAELRKKLGEAEALLQQEKTKAEEAEAALEVEKRQREEQSTQFEGDNDELRGKLRELTLRLEESRKVTTCVEIQGERHLAKFSGEGSVSEWVEDATLALEDWSGSEKGKVRFLINHLTGTARDEVRVRPEAERDTSEKVFALLRASFKSRKTTRQKLGEFFSRTQRPSESVQQFSLALLDLQGKAGKAGERVSAKLLCEQFVEGVADDGLSRELSRLLDREPTLTFADLRDQAIRWSGRAEPSRRSGIVREVEAVDANVQASAAAEPAWRAEMRELREQVKQLTMLMAGAGAGRKASGTAVSPKSAAGPSRFCFKCGSPDHMQRECPKRARVCFGCGLEGHFKRECPKGAKNASSAGNGFPPQSGAML